MKKSFKVGFYIVFGLVNVGIFIFGVYNIKNIIKTYQYSESANLLFFHTTSMNNAIQKYFLEDISNANYHKTNQSEALREYDKYLELVKSEAERIKHADIAKEFGINQQINLLLASYFQFDHNFKKITSRYKLKGYIDYGLEGEMRKSVHVLELNQYHLPLIYILKLRRSEKDYLLRKDLVYLQKLREVIIELKTYIKLQAFDPKTKEAYLNHLNSYEASFLKIVQANEEIKKLQAQNIQLMDAQVTPLLGNIVQSIKIRKEKLIENSIRDFIFLSMIFLASTLIIGYKINQYQLQHLEEIETYIKNLINCEFKNQGLAFKLHHSPSTRRLAIYLQRLEAMVKRQVCCKPSKSVSPKLMKASAYVNVTNQNFTKLI